MRITLILQTLLAVFCQILSVAVIRRIYYTHGMKSKAWIIISISFIILLIKWVLDAIVVHGFKIQNFEILHQGLTDVYAILILIGFYMLSQELSAGDKFSKSVRRSMHISKNVIPEKE